MSAERVTAQLTNVLTNGFQECFQSVTNVGSSVSLPKETTLKEMLYKWIYGYLFPCNKPILGVFLNLLVESFTF
jgi:hypothetical protein